MHRRQAFLTMPLMVSMAVSAADFSGQSALEFTRRAVAFGPRPPGSAAIANLRNYIASELKLRKCQVAYDEFTAQTPVGPIPMKNIIAHFQGTSGRAIAVTGHYDTKAMPGIRFVGANDGGSSTGFLLELARVMSGATRKDDLYLVWFDGEEAFGAWSENNGIYGSKNLARRWASDGTLVRLKALINVDMIGDRDLGILQEMYSTARLRNLVWQTAAQFGYGRYFLDEQNAVEDDHAPFLRAGAPALDLIDFDYGPGMSFWHTERDTMDKLSARSLEVVGTVVVESLRKLEGMN